MFPESFFWKVFSGNFFLESFWKHFPESFSKKLFWKKIPKKVFGNAFQNFVWKFFLEKKNYRKKYWNVQPESFCRKVVFQKFFFLKVFSEKFFPEGFFQKVFFWEFLKTFFVKDFFFYHLKWFFGGMFRQYKSLDFFFNFWIFALENRFEFSLFWKNFHWLFHIPTCLIPAYWLGQPSVVLRIWSNIWFLCQHA